MPDEICCLNCSAITTPRILVFLQCRQQPSYLQVGLAGQTASSVLGKKRLTLDSMKSKVSPKLVHHRFMVLCGPEALKGHRRACDSRRVHLGSLFGSKKSWMIIIMLFGPLDSDRDCMA